MATMMLFGASIVSADPITLNALRSSYIQLQQNNYSQTHMPNTGMQIGYDYTQIPYQDYKYNGYAAFDLSSVGFPVAAVNLQATMRSSGIPAGLQFSVREVLTPPDQVLTLAMLRRRR
jgi:hypothetical protein